MPADRDRADIVKALLGFLETYDSRDDQNTWFEKCKDIAESIGYARETKLYRKSFFILRIVPRYRYMFIRTKIRSFLRSAILRRISMRRIWHIFSNHFTEVMLQEAVTTVAAVWDFIPQSSSLKNKMANACCLTAGMTFLL